MRRNTNPVVPDHQRAAGSHRRRRARRKPDFAGDGRHCSPVTPAGRIPTPRLAGVCSASSSGREPGPAAGVTDMSPPPGGSPPRTVKGQHGLTCPGLLASRHRDRRLPSPDIDGEERSVPDEDLMPACRGIARDRHDNALDSEALPVVGIPVKLKRAIALAKPDDSDLIAPPGLRRDYGEIVGPPARVAVYGWSVTPMYEGRRPSSRACWARRGHRPVERTAKLEMPVARVGAGRH